MINVHPFLKQIYGQDEDILNLQSSRYNRIDQDFVVRFGDCPRGFFSTPGRTELGGNHTDHNHGRVLAGAIDLDMAAVSAKNGSMNVTVYSEGYEQPFFVDLEDLSAREDEQGTTEAMIRGIASRLKSLGYAIGGFDAYITSNVLPGSGLSSSAAVEVLFGTIFNAFYNGGSIRVEEIAKVGQYAENEYFGKPCGLMDQMACAVGGVVAIDFRDPEAPEVKKLAFDFNAHGYDLVIVDTGGDHLDLTDDYAGVPAEMKAIARFFGKDTLRDLQVDLLLDEIQLIRKVAGDRAILRSLHFMDENRRVAKQVSALLQDDTQGFIRLVRASGDSSLKWLQNAYSTRNVSSQGVPLGLATTERFFSRTGHGACRVHGGGFAGAIQVFLPTTDTEAYMAYIKKIFGPESARIMAIRPVGTCFFCPE